MFAGGGTFDAAEEVCRADADTLQSLLDKSLVRRGTTRFGSRYWMLETIRDFAVEQLERLPSRLELQERHAEAFASLARTSGPQLRRGPGQHEWGDRVAEDLDNVRAAVRFGLDHAPELAARIIGNLAFFFWLRGGFAEARLWVDESLARSGGLVDGLVGRLHECGAIVGERLGDAAAASRHADDSYAAFVRAGDEQGIADALRERGKAAVGRGTTRPLKRSTWSWQRWPSESATAGTAPSRSTTSGTLRCRQATGRPRSSCAHEAATYEQSIGDRWGSALALTNVVTAKLHMGEVEEAAAMLDRALRESLAAGATMVVAACIDAAVFVASSRKEYYRVAVLIGATNRVHEELGSTREAFEQSLFSRSLEEARAALGDETFEADVERGATLSVEDAAKTVLDGLAGR